MKNESYPLCWPAGYPRTTSRQKAKFGASREQAVAGLFRELRLLGVRDYWGIILSTNVPIRRDGMPYAGTANPADPGAAVYFRLKEKGPEIVIACDKWTWIADNIRALALTVEAMRGMDRWGCSDMINRAFTGFTALPAPEGQRAEPWQLVIGFDSANDTLETIEARYREMMKRAHPDAGGSHEQAQRLNNAIAQARAEVRA